MVERALMIKCLKCRIKCTVFLSILCKKFLRVQLAIVKKSAIGCVRFNLSPLELNYVSL
jgi:hypothetical protein